MALVIEDSVLFNTNSLQLTFSDNTNYSSFGISLANVLGNLRCTGPTGIFHNNSSWSTPDITLLSGNTINIGLPNLSGIVYSGNYTFDYTIRVLTSLSLEGTIHDPPPNPSGIILSGNQVSLFTTGLIFTIVGGPAAGTYSVLNSVYDSGVDFTYVYVNESIGVDTNQGTVTVYSEYTQSQTFSFTDCSPVVNLDLTGDCDCSQVTSKDLTNYTILVNGGYYAPTSLSRTHTVYSPISPSTGNSVAGSTTSSDAIIIVSPSWTTLWKSTIQTSLTYDIEGLLVQKTVSGSAKLDVECSSELCCAFQCIKNIYDTWIDLKQSNPNRAKEWEANVISISAQWVLYSLATQCGRTIDSENAIKSIIDITKSAGCNCCNGNSAEPAQIISICGAISTTGSGGNVRVTSCGNGIVITPTTVGNTTTYQACLDINIINGIIQNYLDTEPLSLNDLSDVLLTSVGSGNLLRFNGVDWVNVPSISINQITEILVTSPSVGDTLVWNGVRFINQPNTGNVIESALATYTSSGTATQDLHSVPLPSGTFPTNQSMIRGDSEWIVSQDLNAKTIIFSIGGTDFSTPALSLKNVARVLFSFDIIRLNSTQVRVRYEYRLFGNSAGRAYPQLTSTVEYSDPLPYTVSNMDSLSNTLKFRCNPTAGASTITLFDYTVISFKK